MALDYTTNQGGLGSLLTNLIGTGANVYGAQNAAEAATKGAQAGIATEQGTMGNIARTWAPQAYLGAGADTALGANLGLGGPGGAGVKPDYSGFLNMPGYQFAIDQGTQAIQRQATAQGNGYTPNEMINVGKYVTGTAMSDYNTYIDQLYKAAGLGSTANQGLASAYLGTGNNIAQLQSNIGNYQAGGISGVAGALGGAGAGFLGGVLGPGGPGGGLAGWIGKGLNFLGRGGPNGTGVDTTGGLTDASGNPIAPGQIDATYGAPAYDPGNTAGTPYDPNWSPTPIDYTGDLSGGDYGGPG